MTARAATASRLTARMDIELARTFLAIVASGSVARATAIRVAIVR